MKKRLVAAVAASLALALALALAACGGSSASAGGTVGFSDTCTIEVNDTMFVANIDADSEDAWVSSIDGEGLSLDGEEYSEKDGGYLSLRYAGDAAGEQTVTLTSKDDDSKVVTFEVVTDDSGNITSLKASDTDGNTGSYERS